MGCASEDLLFTDHGLETGLCLQAEGRWDMQSSLNFNNEVIYDK